MYKTRAYAATSATSPLAATTIPRREPTERDVQIEISYCGICHSDLHSVRNEWSSVMPTVYPIVPGHEIVGRVTKVGSAVTKFKPGDLAAVGRHNLSGSLIGGLPETQEMLDFCGAHNITADVEVIPIQRVNEAYERLLKADVKYRFSIDMASL
jgi:D-arabinose 1-dehydrogenase-like Zn-dependent alcohol dehydrogenase